MCVYVCRLYALTSGTATNSYLILVYTKGARSQKSCVSLCAGHSLSSSSTAHTFLRFLHYMTSFFFHQKRMF